MCFNRWARYGLAAVAAASLAFGAHADEGKYGGTLVAAFSADPGGFGPGPGGPSGMSHVVIEQVYSTLLNLDENAKPYAGIAESWSPGRRRPVVDVHAARGAHLPQRRTADSPRTWSTPSNASWVPNPAMPTVRRSRPSPKWSPSTT